MNFNKFPKLKNSVIITAAVLFIAAGVFWNACFVFADEFTSTDFTIKEPVITSGGNYSSSTGFQLFGAISQLIIGTSTATSFGVNAGFFYYPYVSSPVVLAAAGDGQVVLTWTESTGVLGWNVSGYNVGQSVVSGGPYTYSSSLGNVTSSTRTGLTNSTTYYFIVMAEDYFGNSIATSTEVSAMPVAAADVSVPAGGGGGGIVDSRQAKIIFNGIAYPQSKITFLKDGQIAATTLSGVDANFEMNPTGIFSGYYLFSFYATDRDGRRSRMIIFPAVIDAEHPTIIKGIFIPPTISVDKSEVKQGEIIAVSGQSAPRAEIAIAVNSKKTFFAKVVSGNDGIYFYNLNTSDLDYGTYEVKTQASIGNKLISEFSHSIEFIVGKKTIFEKPAAKCPAKADFNGDCKVDLIDFSILLYWFGEENPPPAIDLNTDGKIEIIDFSILAYYWTG